MAKNIKKSNNYQNTQTLQNPQNIETIEELKNVINNSHNKVLFGTSQNRGSSNRDVYYFIDIFYPDKYSHRHYVSKTEFDLLMKLKTQPAIAKRSYNKKV